MSRFVPLGRRIRALTSVVRRRPRTAAAVAAVALVAVVGGGIWVAAQPAASAPAPAAGPTFTYASTWTLLDLERHVSAGEVAAISATAAGAQPGELVAKTRDGQVVRIALAVDAGTASQALANLGYGGLFTAEAWDAARAAGGASSAGASPLDPLRTLVTWLVPFGLIGLSIVLLRRFAGRGFGGGRERDAAFSTILPAASAPAGGGSSGVVGEAVEGTRVRLADVAGCEEAKLELTETIEFLRSPERFHRLGARIPHGVLLYGPPGTGKTLLARAVANEAGVPFIAASASEFVEKYVGVGSRRVRELFAQARSHGRAVIFIDEFDALAKTRGGANSHEEREQTLNQLLVELDGFSTTDDVVVIGATNRLDILDPAVLRPGRFNRKIHVGLPDVAGRRDILAVHARGKPMAADVDLETVARKTYGFSGAQLADLLNEAAILAARRGSESIADLDVHNGWLKVAVGTSRRRSMDERERSIIAAHEVGHAICGRLHGDKRKVEEISLFAHGEALGVTVSSQEDNDLPAESDLRARLIALLGGRAAEELLFHEVTGGAANDFEQANRIATLMVTKWGMGRDPEAAERGISGRGPLSFLVARPNGSLPSEVQAAATRATRAILDDAYDQALRTLVDQMELLRKLASYLVEHERVDGETFDALVDGRIEVPNASGEWRPAAARPRAWDQIAGYELGRRPAPRPTLVAATTPTPAASSTEPEGAAAPAILPRPVVVPLAGESRPGAPRGSAWRRRRSFGPTLGRRLRRVAVGYLELAEGFIRGEDEPRESTEP